MRKISASYIFTLTGKPLKNGIIVVSDSGEIIEIIDTQGELPEIQGLEHYAGILSPGFINAHCHLEYSYAKGLIEPNCGLPAFIEQLSAKKSTDDSWIVKCAKQADRIMAQTGCVAVADTTNSSVVAEVKEQSKLYYHTMIECLGLYPQQAERAIEYAQFIGHLHTSSNLKWSIVPHAPYSVSRELLQLIATISTENRSIQSFHHQENINEDSLFQTKTGAFTELWERLLPKGFDFWESTGTTATKATIPHFNKEQPLLLIHNTFMNQKHIDILKKTRSTENTFLITCPQSNLYLEKQLPNYSLWIESGFTIAVGTDSLASNHSISIINELKTIQEASHIEFHELLRWATINGAKALKIEDWAGTLELGKHPGINLITGVNLQTFQFLPNTSAKRLV